MKQILFVRHAKSSWADPLLKDKDRPLNGRGKRDAPVMAKRCFDMGLAIELIITSPAVRAALTAQQFYTQYTPDQGIMTVDNLYHGDVDDYEEALQLLDDNISQVAMFGHNPGLTELANTLYSDRYISNVPTCGVVVATADIEEWSDFDINKAELRDFLFPKQLV